ncbi:cilia- and flagella-associated protein 99 isoform X2 [Phaenicophaeus curvirostris]|uniref:cilia- and flagella-associated protein 99 isoform X2 n=1 Tax=Phaenicophaeus curvirostris TaxID=33595 RepID=UPI0037F0D8F2
MVKMVSHGKHIAMIVQQLNKFNPENQSVEDFLNESAKMLQFLRFFFNALYLNTWIKDEWSHFYDSLYVKENWIDPLLRWQPTVQKLIEQLTDKSSNRTTVVKTSTVTQPKEFNLTVPKPRAIPIPLPIPVLEKRKPVPPSTYKPPKEKKQLEEIKTKNRKKAEDLLQKANADHFRCATMKSEKGENKHDSIKSKPAFQAQKIQNKIDNIPIKLNAAAILREGALYQRKMEQELKRIENLLQGARDPSEFLEWQKQTRGKDLEEQLAEIECRRLQGKLSHEEAVLAHQNVIQENKKKADLTREEKAELMHQYAEKRLQEQKEMRELVEQVMEGHKNAKQAKIKLQKYKQQIVQEVSEENQELLRQALEEEEEKLRKRYELIQQIRAIESLPILKHKFVDLTETGGHGLICEMSIVELRERLALLREAQKAAEEEKRDQIIHQKQAKEQLLLDKLDQISLFREELGRAAALKQEEKKRKSQSGERPVKDERILNLQKKIVEKRTERKKQARLLKITPEKSSVTSGKDSLQWDHWKALEESQE